MQIELRLGTHPRCDIVAYKAINMAGKKTVLRIFPTGSIQGKLYTEDIKSMIIRAPYNMRLILCTVNQDNWEEFPYRCITMKEGIVIPPTKGEATSLPGVRIPDLDFLENPDAKRMSETFHRSYPIVDNFAEGTDWSFGTVGSTKIKENIKMIIVERVEAGEAPPLSDAEDMARKLLLIAKEYPVFDSMKEKALSTLKQKREKVSLENWISKHLLI